MVQWLAGRFRREANLCVVLTPVAFFAGLLGLLFTWWFCFVAVFLGSHAVTGLARLLFDARWKGSPGWEYALATAFFLGLMGEYLRRGTDGLDEFPEFGGEGPSWENAARLYVVTGSPALLLMFPSASAHMILDILFIAPRLLRGAWCLLRHSGELRTIPLEPVAEVLSVLASLPGKLAWDRFPQQFGHLPVDEVWRGLRMFQGVVHLDGGLTLSADLRAELRTAWGDGGEWETGVDGQFND